MDTGHPDATGNESSVENGHCVVAGWLEPDAARLPVPARREPVTTFAASGQVAPFGRVRVVCSSSTDGGGSPTSWITVIAASGDAVYGSVRGDGAILVVEIVGGTGSLDGASGWIRISPPDAGSTAAGVTGDVRFGSSGSTSEPPPSHQRRLGQCGKSDRGAIAEGAES